MSHNIKENDTITATSATWHGLETLVENIDFANSGLDWKVESVPLGYQINDQWHEIEGMQSLVRADKNLYLSNFTDGYQVIQNTRIWGALENALENVSYKVTCSGSLGDCKRVFISVDISGENERVLSNGDQFKNCLTFVNSHDGFSTFRVFDTSTRVVCQNTLSFAMASRKESAINLAVKHTKSADLKIAEMEKTLETLFAQRETAYQTLERLIQDQVTASKAESFLTGFVAPQDAEKKGKISTRTRNQVNAMQGLFARGKGNAGQTRYDLLNGVTEFLTHDFTDNKARKVSSGFFGLAATQKSRAFQTLSDNESFEKVATRGEKLLKL